MVNPIAAAPTDKHGEIQRDVFCCHYDECLGVAIERDWENFTCIGCSLFKPFGRSFDKWLEENTINCKLGRITLEQCERNRGRKGIAEPFNLRDRSTKAIKAGMSGIFRPSACESCTEWRSLKAEFNKKKLLRNRTGEMNQGGNASKVPEAGEKRVCGQCGREFTAYRHGVTVVKAICMECLHKKISPPERKDSAAIPAASAANGTGPAGAESISISFSGQDAKLLQLIREISAKDRRTVDSQILYWLETHVPSCVPLSFDASLMRGMPHESP